MVSLRHLTLDRLALLLMLHGTVMSVVALLLAIARSVCDSIGRLIFNDPSKARTLFPSLMHQ